MSDLLGKKVRDKITGFEGIATGYCIYWPDPRPSYFVTPVVDPTGKYNDSKWIDNVNLEEHKAPPLYDGSNPTKQ